MIFHYLRDAWGSFKCQFQTWMRFEKMYVIIQSYHDLVVNRLASLKNRFINYIYLLIRQCKPIMLAVRLQDCFHGEVNVNVIGKEL